MNSIYVQLNDNRLCWAATQNNHLGNSPYGCVWEWIYIIKVHLSRYSMWDWSTSILLYYNVKNNRVQMQATLSCKVFPFYFTSWNFENICCKATPAARQLKYSFFQNIIKAQLAGSQTKPLNTFYSVSVTFGHLPWQSLGLRPTAHRCLQEGNSRVIERSGLHTAATATKTVGSRWGAAGGLLGSRWWDSSPFEGSSSHWSTQWGSNHHWLHQT